MNKRREFLKASAALAGAAGGLSRIEVAGAAAIQVPVVDKLTINVLVDSSQDWFFKPSQVNGVSIQPGPRPSDFRRTLHNQWGLSLFLESQRGSEQRDLMLDYGYSADALLNNIDILKVDPSKVSALIISHGHFDHYGGLIGFLDKYRDKLPADVRLYAGGEDNFCHRVIRSGEGQFTDFGTLDRRELAKRKVATVLAETPTIIEGHAFTTGTEPRTSIEHVLPNTWVEIGIKDGLGCDAQAYMNQHFNAEELAGKPQPDQHWHEHATCFRLGDRGLVVISSCGHAGIINTLKRAQEVSGVERIYALVGGFHLAPAPDDYLRQVMAELEKFDLEHVMPMHCSGQNFIDLASKEMPEKLVLCGTGSSFTFTA